MSYENILVETKGKVGIIRLNRPQALNALNSALIAEFHAAIAAFEADAEHLLHDRHRLRQGLRRRRRHQGNGGQESTWMPSWATSPPIWDPPARARKPIIAAVAGFALGGGCEIAMQCDMIIAADNAKFGQPEIKLGVIPGMGGTQRLTRAVGKAKAMDLILTGRMMDAAEAERAGLVARVVPLASLMDEAMKAAETIASMSLPALMVAKEAVNARSKRRSRKACASSGARFMRCSRRTIRRKAWRRSSRSGRRSSRINRRVSPRSSLPHADDPHDGILRGVRAGAAGDERHLLTRPAAFGSHRPERSRSECRACGPATTCGRCTATPANPPSASIAAAPAKPCVDRRLERARRCAQRAPLPSRPRHCRPAPADRQCRPA